MAKTKWRCREYNPSGNMTGSHSFYAEAVISNDLTNDDLASRIQARTGFKSYEVQAVIAAIAEVVAEEVLESNRITLADTKGTKMLSIYPKVSGSVSDADIQRETTAAHALDPSKPIRSVAEESDLTPERLTWTLGATMGVKFSKQFAHDKQAQKVKFVGTDTAIPNDDAPDNPNGGETPVPTANVVITANVNDPTMGTVTGGGTYVQGASVTLTATPNAGYHFVQWSNGRTTASITVTAEADATLTATFAADNPGGNGGDNGMDG